MTAAIDICTQAAVAVGALDPEETMPAGQENFIFGMLNDLVDQWSDSPLMIPYKTEIIWTLTSSQFYTIGPGGTIGGTFTGSVSTKTLTVSAISAGNIALGQTITGTGVTAGTKVTAFLTGSGGVGTYTINIAHTLTSRTFTSSYARPLRINSGFVRSSQLDYPLAILNIEQYELIGLKTLQGAWPRAIYYQPADPVGNITVWPAPGAGEMHLFADTVLQSFTTSADVITLAQGYNMALRWSLAELLIPIYPATGAAAEVRQYVPQYARDARAWVKRTNMQPPQFAQFDPYLMQQFQNGSTNPAWIYSGGFS